MAKFELDLMRFTKGLNVNGSKVMRKATFDMYGGVVVGTRVDTGRARLNWNVSIGGPDARTRPEPSVSPAAGGAPGGDEMRQSGVQGTMLALKAGAKGSVFICNSLAYIGHLDRLDKFILPVVATVKDKIEKGAYND